MTLCDDLPTLFKANDMCNRAGAGLDLRRFQRGLCHRVLRERNPHREGHGRAGAALGRLDPRSSTLLEKIIEREGIGDVLADGVRVAAKKIGKGAERYAMEVGGQEVPMHDPRLDPGFGVVYQAEPTPGRHTIASLTYGELMALDEKFPWLEQAAGGGLEDPASTRRTRASSWP